MTGIDVYDHTRSHGGGTFRQEHDGSYALVTSGSWAVGIHAGTFRTVSLAEGDGSGHSRRNLLGSLYALRVAYPDALAGTWTHRDDIGTDVIDIDPVSLVADKDEALALAREHAQQAIYNLDTGETVYLGRGRDGM